MQELIQEYEKTLKANRRSKRELDKKINALKMIYEDTNTPNSIRHVAKEEEASLREDKTILSSCEKDLLYILQWLKTGKCPDHRRGIERRSVYQRTIFLEPQVLDNAFGGENPIYEWDKEPSESTDEQALNQVLNLLTKKELQVYTLRHVEQDSQYEIADKLGISRNSVKTMLCRADKKIQSYLSQVKEGECNGVCAADSEH